MTDRPVTIKKVYPLPPGPVKMPPPFFCLFTFLFNSSNGLEPLLLENFIHLCGKLVFKTAGLGIPSSLIEVNRKAMCSPFLKNWETTSLGNNIIINYSIIKEGITPYPPERKVKIIMKHFDEYTAAVVQPRMRSVAHRKEIQPLLQRYLQLIDYVTDEGAASNREFAPVKLIAFPEFFLQGYDSRWNLKKILKDIAITLPGEETEALAQRARQYGIYIAGTVLEIDPYWPDRFFNTALIIDPRGEIIHRYRKFTVATYLGEISTSPHDMYDQYVERYGETLEAFFPVTDTEIGRLGTLICMDANLPENARALALNGCEVLIRMNAYPEPLVSAPFNYWEGQNRTRAWENLLYVVAPNIGLFEADEPSPQTMCPGHSMIVGYDGSVLAETPYPGEAATSALINLSLLRKRRKEIGRNFLVQLKTEVYKLIYEKPIHPINACAEKPYQDAKDYMQREPLQSTIEEFIKKGIFAEPRPL